MARPTETEPAISGEGFGKLKPNLQPYAYRLEFNF